MKISPPYSQEAEESLLGSVFVDPACITMIDIRPEDFFIHRHRWIWQALQSLTEKRSGIDTLTVCEELERLGKLTEVGGPAYLAKLVSGAYSSLHVESYADIVRDRASRRRILDIANELSRSVYDDSQDINEASAKAVQSIASSLQTKHGARHIKEYVSELYDDVVRRAQNPQDVYGMATGLADLDVITGGLQKSELFYLAGRSGLGKSILAVQMGVGMATGNHPGVIYSLEMEGMVVTRRMISALGKLVTRDLKTGRIAGDDWNTFVRSCADAEQLPIFLSDSSYLTTSGLRADLARLKAQYGIEWFLLDYLYLMSDGIGSMSIVERTELLSARMKMLCKEFDLAGIAINSVTKEGDVRGSEQVKHDADIVCMLSDHAADSSTNFVNKSNIRTLSFVKARELESSKVYIHLVKHDAYPLFDCIKPEPNAQRV